MQFDFLDFRATINKNALSISKITESLYNQSDVDNINNDIVNNIITLGEEHYYKKLEDLTLISPAVETKEYLSEAMAKFKNDGIFVIPNFLDVTNIEQLCKSIEEKSHQYYSKVHGKDYYEDNNALIQTKLIKKKNYRDLASSTKPVINVRSGADQGMIDIFNVDKLITDPNSKEIIQSIRENTFLNSFLELLDPNITIKNINSYINTGISKTRGFHADSYTKQLKIFIYLTDVTSFNNGPYTFVKSTNIDSSYRRLNQAICKGLDSKTETPLVPFASIYPVLAKKGSLIISDQAGFHRGFPQSPKGNRRVLTINCQ